MPFNERSLKNLKEVHEDLQKVTRRAMELADELKLDFVITDGRRTIEEQRHYVATGKSKTMHSRHLGGFAIDFVARVDGKVSYEVGDMEEIADLFKAAADELGIPIHWGGDWTSFKDTPHIELDKKVYPDVGMAV